MGKQLSSRKKSSTIGWKLLGGFIVFSLVLGAIGAFFQGLAQGHPVAIFILVALLTGVGYSIYAFSKKRAARAADLAGEAALQVAPSARPTPLASKEVKPLAAAKKKFLAPKAPYASRRVAAHLQKPAPDELTRYVHIPPPAKELRR